MKKIIVVSLLLVLLVGSTAFAGGQKEEGYIIGSDCTWPPFEYVDENGDIVGFEVDLIAAISEYSKVPMTVRNVAWDGIFAGLSNGAYDAVVSGVTILDERKEVMDFTTPILEVTQSILVTSSNTNISKSSDVVGKKIGVQIGTTGQFALEAIGGVTIKSYDEIGLAVEDLLNNNLDAVVADSIIAADFVLANENYAGKLLVKGTLEGDKEQIGWAVKKGNSELLTILNDGIKAMQDNGTVAKLACGFRPTTISNVVKLAQSELE